MKCACGTDMLYYKGIVEDGDYLECPKCKNLIYVNEVKW